MEDGPAPAADDAARSSADPGHESPCIARRACPVPPARPHVVAPIRCRSVPAVVSNRTTTPDATPERL
ncbi:hypothetical protein PMIN01_13016 [Paraphaeosphaeria minitans]|uniref:Uncharacterized protein n=1 Tax=Paraphaeosphaeria minitans TaxID=565426 RepID=A0A9P6KK80_9PLEO|nr:hypothetical protein PMIN01_13016 [Paraphaeosphaeria minitans]